MNPVSRRELKAATWALAGVAVLGVALGIENSVTTLGAASSAGGRGVSIPFNPAMANSTEAKAIAPDAIPAPPTAVADTSSTAKVDEAASDTNAEDEAGPASDAAAPPTLYAPPEAGPAAPAGAAADDNNLPPY